MFTFNTDFAVEHIKSICDNTQCITCDKLIGRCVRFSCGHSICEACAERTGECLYCISSSASYLVDKPQTARLNNAVALLTAFQDTFQIDVYKRQRISDHLKVEKLMFPQCIQAPYKYCNKRKNLNVSLKNKENSPKIFPGEEIKVSDTAIMKKSVQYVQNWLNQHESTPQNLPRKPFGDINVNNQSRVHKTKQDVTKLPLVHTKVDSKQSTCQKRSHLKTIHKTPSLSNNVTKNNLELKKLPRHLDFKKEDKNFGNSHISYKCDGNESGIVIDDEPFVIEDTCPNIVDKDKQAWLAVLDAAKKDEHEAMGENKNEKEIENNNCYLDIYEISPSTSVVNGNKAEKIELRFPKNVLFYKKSSLYETCKLCNNYLKPKINTSTTADKSSDLSIVINNSAFITTIKFTHCEEKQMTNKNSVAIQTEEDLTILKHEMSSYDGNVTPHKRKNMTVNNDVPIKILKPNYISQSFDVFASDKNIKQNTPVSGLKPHKCLIIEDSDTDSSNSCDNIQEVAAEVHRPHDPESVECGILRTLSKFEYEHKAKRQIRACTPNSSNSSDKENVDPNRKKAVRLGKKKKQNK